MESDVTQSALFYKLWAWGDAHKKQLLLGLLAVIIVGVGIAFWFAHQTQAQTDANDALSTLVAHTVSPTAPAPTPNAFLKVTTDYPNSDAGQRALLLGASDLYAQGKYDEARGEFQRFLQQYSDSRFVGEAALGVAACMDAQSMTNDAIAAYRNVADHYQQDWNVAPDAKLALARLFLGQGNLADAKGQLQDILRDYPGQVSAEASRRLQELIMAHPELMPPTAPPPQAAPNPAANRPPVIISTNRPAAAPSLMISTNHPSAAPVILPSAGNKP